MMLEQATQEPSGVRRGSSRLRRLYGLHCGRCYYCRRTTLLCDAIHGRLSEDHATIDHFYPSCRGGTDTPGNRVLACYSCNQRKGDLPPYEFIESLDLPETPAS